jgi:hypothetical protein
MFGRRRRERVGDARAGNAHKLRNRSDPAIGIGAQVVVIPDPGSSDDWSGEPSGVVVAPGDNEFFAYPATSMGAPTRWTVAFDEPQYTADGRGPIDQASIPSWRLEVAPEEPVDSAGTDDSDESEVENEQ